MFEKETVEVTCPTCGHKSQENVGRLKNDDYTCPECGITLDANQLARALMKAECGVENLKGEIAKLKKRLDQVVLLHQRHVNEDKHESKTLEELRAELAANTGENIVIRRFAKFQVGEE